MSTEPANDLSKAVKAALLPHLGDYKDGTTVKAKAYWPVTASVALVAEGLNPTWKPSGVEAIFALYPEDEDGPREFTSLDGTRHHQLVLKAWSGSTWPAREALKKAFPLLSTRIPRRARVSPAINGAIEMVTLYLPTM